MERDATEAAKLYRAADDQGMSAAQYNLGVCYATGSGVPLNPAEAVKWYRQAATQGHPTAQKLLLESPPATSVAEKTAAEKKPAELARPSVDHSLTSAPPTGVRSSTSQDSPGELANPPTPTDSQHFEQLIIALFLALGIAIVAGGMMFSSHKTRLASLENEIKAARYEVTRASTSLATILKMVEERLTLAEEQRVAAILESGDPPLPQLADDTPVTDTSEETSVFKTRRPRSTP